jgi:hypothetical protein
MTDTEKKRFQFRDITWLPELIELMETSAKNARNQIGALEMSIGGNTLLDEQILDHTIDMYGQLLELSFHRDAQLDKWLGLNLSKHQRSEVERLIDLNQVIQARVERILDLCDEIKHSGLERDFEGSDFQTAIDAFMGNIVFQGSLSDEECLEIVKKISRFVEEIVAAGGGNDDIVNHPDMMACAMNLQKIVATAKPSELEALDLMYPGFAHFRLLFQSMTELMMRFKAGI